ncbi:hypothetical protein ACJW8B_03250 [Plesiomonas shigelloides]|uniref:hypothetical protein n=1 Tax=Plesiomonas shigelloides TaxID=703 RepID=UPI00387F3246
MKYDELKAIADAIISSNDKMIYLNLVMISISIAVVYFGALFKKTGELTAIKVAFTDIQKQNEIITTDTETIKRQLEKGSIEYQIKLSKYHEKKIDAIENIHSKLASLIISSRQVMLSSDGSAFITFNTAVEEFRNCFEIKKLWLNSSVSRKIEDFAIEIDKQVKQYQCTLTVSKMSNLQGQQVQQMYDRQDDFYEFIASQSADLKEQLEEALRHYLSPQGEA